MTDKPVRTRFAPSPTGPLHIGGVRTALFTWLTARHGGGKFILRIEDTDQERFVPGSIEEIIDVLTWLGMDIDEGPHVGGDYGPYVQSERLDLYQKWANWLLEQGKAYKAYETREELEAIRQERQANGLPPGYDGRARRLTPDQIAAYEAEGRKPVVRFKVPEGETTAYDLIRGKVRFKNSELQDAVLLKADGFPTYHLANIVDDHFMQISHVTRANEWLPSLPLHWLLWEAFGWEKPVYAHLPVLLNPNGKGKLSKRTEAFTQSGNKILVRGIEYRQAGYLPEAVVNFLTNIGWNYGDDQEIFTVEDAIARFDLGQVNDSNSAFPFEKLDWLNGEYIRRLTTEDLARRLKPVFENAGYTVDDERLLHAAPMIQTRIKTLTEAVELAGFLFADAADFTPAPADDLTAKKLTAAQSADLLDQSVSVLREIEPFEHSTLYERFKQLAKSLGVKNGQLFGSLRVAITGQTISTPTFETMEVLGRDETIRRVEMGRDVLKQTPEIGD